MGTREWLKAANLVLRAADAKLRLSSRFTDFLIEVAINSLIEALQNLREERKERPLLDDIPTGEQAMVLVRQDATLLHAVEMLAEERGISIQELVHILVLQVQKDELDIN